MKEILRFILRGMDNQVSLAFKLGIFDSVNLYVALRTHFIMNQSIRITFNFEYELETMSLTKTHIIYETNKSFK